MKIRKGDLMKNLKTLRALLVIGALLSLNALNAAEGDSKSKGGQGSSIKDNGFYSGDKSISLTSDGEIVYLADGKEVMRGGCIIRTDFSENLISPHKGTARKQNLEVNEKAGTITFKSEFPLNKGELNDGNSFGLYKCALTELPDKRIKLEINIEIPDAKRKPAFIGTSSLLFKLPFVCCQGKSFSVNSEKYMFTGEGKASTDANVLYSDTAAKNFVFTPEDLKTQFKIEIESCKSLVVKERLLNNWEGPKVYMDITASPEGKITLIFDLGSANTESGK